MRVRLYHLDGNYNLALMRIAAHHRALGDEVSLVRAGNVGAVEHGFFDEPATRTYASLIFKRTRPLAERLLEIHPEAVVGGTGWAPKTGKKLLELGITTKRLDYSIYPRLTASIGFSQRGCRLRCGFCVVPVEEGDVREENTIADIWRGDPWPRHVVLLDNDFFGQERWRDRIAELRDGAFRVSFTQGINARMIGDEEAQALASVDYRSDDMKTKRLYCAWDNHKDGDRLFRGLHALERAGVKPDEIMVYMLIGWNDDPEDREHRRRELRAFGARPYPMPFQRTRELVGFQRWVIGAYDKRFSWAAWEAAGYRPERLGLPAQREQLSLFGAP